MAGTVGVAAMVVPPEAPAPTGTAGGAAAVELGGSPPQAAPAVTAIPTPASPSAGPPGPAWPAVVVVAAGRAVTAVDPLATAAPAGAAVMVDPAHPGQRPGEFFIGPSGRLQVATVDSGAPAGLAARAERSRPAAMAASAVTAGQAVTAGRWN